MDIGIAPTEITLDSRFTDFDRPVLLTGIQALLRLLLEQRRLDKEAGLSTAALVSGYRGSPLGGLDRELSTGPPDGRLLCDEGLCAEPGRGARLRAARHRRHGDDIVSRRHRNKFLQGSRGERDCLAAGDECGRSGAHQPTASPRR